MAGDSKYEYKYDCVADAGFAMDPNEQKRVGYVTTLNGFGQSLAPDLTVYVPFNTGAKPDYSDLDYIEPEADSPVGSANVVGVIKQFQWTGGRADGISIDFYVSQDNASIIIDVMQRALPSKDVTQLGWWIVDYDQEGKSWFEQSYPYKTNPLIEGRLNGTKSGEKSVVDLGVSMIPEKVKGSIDVSIYLAHITVVPAMAKLENLYFASSHQRIQVRQWGVQIGI